MCCCAPVDRSVPSLRLVLLAAALLLCGLVSPAWSRQVLSWTVRGTLGPGDATDPRGRYFDEVPIDGIAIEGQWIIAKVTTRGFDPIIEVQVGAQRVMADDAHGSRLVAIAHVPVAASVAGFRVVVSSWKEGATGSYTLEVEVRDDFAWYGIPPIATLSPGEDVRGYLDQTDPVVRGRAVETYTLHTEPMQFYDIVVQVGLDMAGAARFDPVLQVLVDGGEELLSDDAIEMLPGGAIATRIDRSHIRFFSPAPERLTVVVRPFRERTGGPYILSVSRTRPTLFAVSAGFDLYQKASPLTECAEDARRIVGALGRVGLSDENTVLVHQTTGVQAVDQAGNPVASSRDAILDGLRRLGARMGPYDLMVFFYSGHGGRVLASSYSPADPDGFAEYLALPEGGRLFDHELAEALPSGTRVLVMIDACFSGGFARNMVDRPGRAGVFSSPEDATSLVWSGRGGGYLAPLFEEALGDRGRFGGPSGEYPADVDQDGVITLAELSLYMQRRYREEIDRGAVVRPPATPSLDGERFIDTGQFPGWQHLVVDRAGLAPFQPLFILR